MLAVVDRYFALPEAERLTYKVGRWGGVYRSLEDLEDPVLRAKVEEAIRQLNLEEPGQVDIVIKEMADQYI
jgi:hypothetical protein